jgi:[1-hydroxy-2-(trimethylamino)ethyl]phosphonate dioxygenase
VSALGSVADIVALYDRFGGERYGEDVTQTDHACQCAALAQRDGAEDALVVAALLHDVGHLLHLSATGEDAHAADVDDDHEALGARALAALFGPEVTGPIALHVTAKRYRCAVDPTYLSRLSAASVASLRLQGGPLDGDAADQFARHPAAAAALRLREWDDTGKVAGLEVPDFADFVPRLTAARRL